MNCPKCSEEMKYLKHVTITVSEGSTDLATLISPPLDPMTLGFSSGTRGGYKQKVKYYCPCCNKLINIENMKNNLK